MQQKIYTFNNLNNARLMECKLRKNKKVISIIPKYILNGDSIVGKNLTVLVGD